MNKKVNIAVFASGRGSNARAIYRFTQSNDSNFQITCILSNRKNAAVLDFASENAIPHHSFNRKDFAQSNKILGTLKAHKTDMIVLAGFLWLIPEYLVEAYPKKIVNIHPALLPKYGGKGMYGRYVHEAVHNNKESKSGMTIHFVNEKYDEGQMIFQAQCQLKKSDTPSDIARRVLELEHHFYPQVINGVASRLVQ